MNIYNVPNHGFFSILWAIGGSWSSTRGINQIWLKVKQENKLFKEYYFFYIPTSRNVLSKYVNFSFKNPQNMVTLLFFFPKNNFYPSWIFFSWCNFLSQKEINAMHSISPISLSIGIFVQIQNVVLLMFYILKH